MLDRYQTPKNNTPSVKPKRLFAKFLLDYPHIIANILQGKKHSTSGHDIDLPERNEASLIGHDRNFLTLISILCFNILLLSCMFSNGLGLCTRVCNDCMEITVIDIHRIKEIKTLTNTQTPPDGKAIIVVDTNIKVLEGVSEADLDLGLITLMNEDKEIISDLKGYGGIGRDPIVLNLQECYDGCHLLIEEGEEYFLGFVFLVDEKETFQTFNISFEDMDSVHVSLDN